MLLSWPSKMLLAAFLLVAGGMAVGWSSGPDGASAQPNSHEMHATVTDEHGRLVHGLLVSARVYGDGPGVYQARRTATGSARFQLVEGVYRLFVETDRYSKCTVSGIDNPTGRPNAVFTAEAGVSSRIEIVVSKGIPWANQALVPCRFDVPFHHIRGTVSGPGGEPLQGVAIRALGELGDDSRGPWRGLPTNAEGRFQIEVPDGTYSLDLSLEFADGGTCELGSFGSDGRRAPYWEVTRLVVSGGDIEGLTISLPDLCQRVEGVLVNAEGEPVAGTWVIFRDSETQSERTDATGTFSLLVPEGSYFVEVQDGLGGECTVEGYDGVAPGRPARIDVGGGGVDGLRIALSAGTGAGPVSIRCFFPAAMATTTLQPGWNLAGWTAEETDVGALFEAMPALDAVHAWDAGTQSFARAARDDPEGAGDLTTFAPGMGLRLHLGGEEPFTWARPVVPAGGFVSLQPGWNLVAWAGRDGATPEDAFAFLREDLLAAAAWDATTGKFRLHYPGAPPIVNTLRRLERGEALWLKVGVARRWLQPGATGAAVEFVGEVHPDTRAAIVPRLDDVLSYFGERTGTFVPALTVSVGDHPGVCADYGSRFRTIRLSEGCLVAIAHEYAHAIQFTVGAGASPAWLVEGAAERWSAQYYDDVGGATYEAHVRDVAIPSARFIQRPLEELESLATFKAYGGGAYGLVHLAVDWLASHADGDEALLGYFDARSHEEDWQVTFERVFGMGVDDYYASFGAHRAELALPHPLLEGAVRNPDGTPVVGATVHARRVLNENVRTVTTRGDGTFALVLQSGAYDIWLTVDGCILPWSSSGLPVNAVTAHRSRLELDEGVIAKLVITPSATPADTCQWGWIRGTVSDLAGNPRGGVMVYANTWVDGDEVETSTTPDWTADDGAFALRVIEGRYRLLVRVGAAYGDYERHRGLTLHQGNATPIVVGATDAGEVTVQFGVVRAVMRGLSATPDLRVGLHEGATSFYQPAKPEIQFIAPGGTFLMAVYCPDFRLVGWYGGADGLVTDRSQAASIVLDDADVTLTLDVPAGVTCQ